MTGSLGYILANIVMKASEAIVNQFTENDIVEFYRRCIYYTLIVIKKKNIDLILNKCNKLNKNLKFF